VPATFQESIGAVNVSFPELETGERRRVTLAHALSMTAGFEWNENNTLHGPS